MGDNQQTHKHSSKGKKNLFSTQNVTSQGIKVNHRNFVRTSTRGERQDNTLLTWPKSRLNLKA